MNYKITTKDEFENFICQNWNSVNKYLDDLSRNFDLPFYNSVDIRESKTKIAPIDNNLYPAGFNNLCYLDLAETTRQIEILFTSKNIKSVALMGESNTKNLFYLDHLAVLKKTIEDAGVTCSLVSFDDELFDESGLCHLTSKSNFELTIEKATLNSSHHICSKSNSDGYDFFILNHDQSKPINVDWATIQTPISPSPFLGWTNRKKGEHFLQYEKIITTFCNEFSISIDLIMAKFSQVSNVDFLTKEGLGPLAKEIDQLKSQINKDNKIFVKASQGTYGMGISVVESGEEIINMNRKMRNKMNAGKNSLKFSDILVQEAIPTVLTYDNNPAEVTIYLIKGKPVGGFMRTNSEKDKESNLNSKGMVFRKFCISEIRQNSDHKNKEAAYSIIARLSAIASANE